jgi:hypothetical protein
MHLVFPVDTVVTVMLYVNVIINEIKTRSYRIDEKRGGSYLNRFWYLAERNITIRLLRIEMLAPAIPKLHFGVVKQVGD